MKLGTKILSVACSAFLALTFAAGCGKKDDEIKDVYKYVDYSADHTSANRMVTFASSDSGVDSFLNEYRTRHMRDDENMRIHTHPVGAGSTPWKEWESLTGSWWDAGSANGTMTPFYSTNEWVDRFVREPKQDKQGYVWTDNGIAVNSWGMGWEFPNYEKNLGAGWDFVTKNDKGVVTGDTTDNFTTNSGVTMSASNSDLTLKGKNVSEITAVSPDFEVATLHAPFVKLCFTFEGEGSFDAEDLYVYYRMENGEFNENDKVAFSDFSTTGYDIGKSSVTQKQGYFFPLYLKQNYGAARNNRVVQYKVALKAKSGTTLSGTLKLDYLVTDYDDRQPINACNYILSAKNILEYSQNEEELKQVIRYARKSMNFLTSQLKGSGGLIDTTNLVGHSNDGTKKLGYGIGNGYWDVLAFPTVNLYSNISYYNAIRAMQYLEEMAEYYKIPAETVTTLDNSLQNTVTYSYTAKTLKELGDTCKSKFQKEFWNASTGRFHGGKRDGDGSIQDNGYLMFNEQAVAAGIATKEQAESIMSWINGERTVSSDISKGADIYKYEIAPRFNTAEIGADFLWAYSTQFGGNVQNGGTALQNSYYDLCAQAAISKQKAYEKLKNLQAWYERVQAAGGTGWNFYRKYFESIGVPVQGGNSGGVIGVDYEFLEAALLIAAVPDAFFGLDTGADNTLVVSPGIPDQMDYWRMENLVFSGRYYDLSAGSWFVQVSAEKEYNAGSLKSDAKLTVRLKKPTFAYKVFINGVETEAYTVLDGKIVVTVPFGNVKVEVRDAAYTPAAPNLGQLVIQSGLSDRGIK